MDRFEDVLRAKGSLAVGSQLSLTQSEGDMVLLCNLLEELKPEDVRATISAHADDSLLPSFIKAVFRGSSVGEEAALQRRLEVYAESFRLAQSGSQLRRDSVFNFLLVEAANLPADVLASLAEKALASVHKDPVSAKDNASKVDISNVVVVSNAEDRWSPFEFLPALLVRIVDLPPGGVDPRGLCTEDLSMHSGRQFVLQVLRDVCKRAWPANAATMIISTLQEMASHFSEDLVVEIVRKGMHQIRTTTYPDLPRLVQQLFLLLTSVSMKPQRQVEAIDELIFVLEDLNTRYTDTEDPDIILGKENKDQSQNTSQGLDAMQLEEFKTLLQAEGAIVSHFCMTAAKHLDLGRAFVKTCAHSQNGVMQLTPVRVAFLLGLAKIKRLETHVVDVFIARVSMASACNVRAKASRWISSWYKAGQPTQHVYYHNHVPLPVDKDAALIELRGDGLFSVFDTVIEYSVRGGWDAVVQSLALVGVQLMDTSNQYRPAHRIARDVRQPGYDNVFPTRDRILLDAKDPHVIVGELGVNILSTSFAKHSIVQRDVLECIKMRLVSASGSIADHGVIQVVRLLAALVDQAPELLLREMTSLKDMLAGLPRISPRTAAGILLALQPLFEVRADMVDFGILVFRKALFQRDLQPRLVAVQGLLLLLRCCPLEQQTEIINCVHRCLGHQMQVRAALYAGLGAVQTDNAELRALIKDMLCSHLESMLVVPITSTSSSSSSLAKMANGDDNEDIDHEDESAATQPQQKSSSMDDDSGVFPLLVAERCLDRSSGGIADPVHILLDALLRIGATDVVAQVHERLCVFSGPLESLGSSSLPLSICEVLLHYKFDKRLWILLCKLMGTSSSSSSSGMHAGTSGRKSRKEALAAPADDDEAQNHDADDAEADDAEPGEASEDLPAATQTAQSLSVRQLLDLLDQDEIPQVVRQFALSSLATSLHLLRETRKVSAQEAQDRILGIDINGCCDAARMGAGFSPETSQTLVGSAGKYLTTALRKPESYTQPVGAFLAFQECLDIAIDLEATAEFLRASFGLDASEDDASAIDTSIGLLRQDIFDTLLNAIEKPRIWTRLIPMAQILLNLMPLSSDPSQHNDWVQDNLMERQFRNSKFSEMAMQLYLVTSQLSMPDGHDLAGATGFAVAVYHRLGKREDLAEDESSDDDSSDDDLGIGNDDDDDDEKEINNMDDDSGDEEAQSHSDSDAVKDSEDEQELGDGDDDPSKKRKGTKQSSRSAKSKESSSKKKANSKKRQHISAAPTQSQTQAAQVAIPNVDFLILNDRSRGAAILVLLQHLSFVLDECEWAASHMKDDPISVAAPISFNHLDLTRAKKRRRDQDKLINEKLRQIQVAWSPIIRAELTDHKCYDVLVKVQTRLYKLLASQLKIRASQRNASTPLDLRKLLRRTCMNSEFTYKMLRYRGAATSTSAANIAKEAKSMPLLVYQIEQYDVQLVRLAKMQRKNAALSFTDFVYNMAAWDFQIRVSAKKRARPEKVSTQRSEESKVSEAQEDQQNQANHANQTNQDEPEKKKNKRLKKSATKAAPASGTQSSETTTTSTSSSSSASSSTTAAS